LAKRPRPREDFPVNRGKNPITQINMKSADSLFINAQILTQDQEKPKASQMAISGKHILAIGDDLSAFKGETTKTIDLEGSVVAPGFIDAHIHFLWGGEGLLTIPGHKARSKQEFINIISKYAQKQAPGSWLKGGGWNEHLFTDKGLPHKSWLDEAAPGHPMVLHRHDGHSAIASSTALELAGITANMPDPVGGLIDKDENGEPTGILRESAILLVDSLIPEETEEVLEKNFKAAQEYLLERGVTCVGDMIYDMKHFSFLQKMARQGKLKIRITAYVPLLKWEEIKQHINKGIYEDEWFQFKGLKGFCDGSLGSHTALMLEPYDDNPDSVGIYDTDWEDINRVKEIILESDRNNLQSVIHAIGDRANREVLDMFESVIKQNGARDRRFRIEHAQHIHPEDQKRFAELYVIPSVQPAHCLDDSLYADKLLGERCGYVYPFNSLNLNRAKLAFGSDWPVSPANPVATIHAAIHRAGWRKEEAVSMETALEAHTTGAAYAGFRENDLGMLKEDYLADFVVLDPKFLELDFMERITENIVSSVYVNGNRER